MITNLEDQLKRDEGLSLIPYLDSVGIKTIGYGHNLIANPLPFDVSHGITLEQAEEILKKDIALKDFQLNKALPWLDKLDEVRHGVLINMAFNLGINGLLAFKETLHNFQIEDFAQAAQCMRESKWYGQVGIRARRLVIQTVTGIWQ